jgi:hypothetical protein
MAETDANHRESNFVRHFLRTTLVLLGIIALAIALVDPVDTLPLSLPLDRFPADVNQRFTYVPIARSNDFDSLIIGTSTTRMLDPARLDGPLDARIANLSMNSGTWWEQEQMFRLFLRHHPTPKLVLWGIDTVWCRPADPGPRLTPRRYPDWLYDENPWNDYLHLLNFDQIEWTGRQLGIALGLKKPTYGRNGYANLNKDGTSYDLAKARKNIYGQTSPIPAAAPLPAPAYAPGALGREPYPNVAVLKQLVSQLPEQTQVVLLMVPYHQHELGAVNGATMLNYEECKKRVFAVAQTRRNTSFLDFMFRSAFTSEDANYWDHMHYNDQGAAVIERAIVDHLVSGKVDPGLFRTAPLP